MTGVNASNSTASTGALRTRIRSRLSPLFKRLQAFLEVGHRLLQLGEPAEYRGGLEPVAVVDGGIAGDERAGVDGIGNPRLRGRDRALADGQMSGDADLPGQRDAILDRAAAGDAHLRREQRVAADL